MTTDMHLNLAIDEPLMPIGETATFMGLPSPRHLSRLCSRKAGPRYFLLGGRRYFRRADVLAWLAERCVDPAIGAQAA